VPFTEYKGSADIPVTSETSSLKVENGKVRVPSGPGFGVTIEPLFVREAVRVKST
jgi:L-alanine-DL-glutamate epimerase-like enolase superfamily enzyme